MAAPSSGVVLWVLVGDRRDMGRGEGGFALGQGGGKGGGGA